MHESTDIRTVKTSTMAEKTNGSADDGRVMVVEVRDAIIAIGSCMTVLILVSIQFMRMIMTKHKLAMLDMAEQLRQTRNDIQSMSTSSSSATVPSATSSKEPTEEVDDGEAAEPITE